MSKGRKFLGELLETLGEDVPENVSLNLNENVLLNLNENVNDEVADIVEENVANNVHVKSKRWKPNPKSFEANYTRKTVFIRNDLYNILDDFSVYKGDITTIVNESLEAYFKKKNKKNN